MDHEPFNGLDSISILSPLQHGGHYPLDAQSLVTSYNDLKNILTERITNIYDGMIISLADDLSDSKGNYSRVSNSDWTYKGLYWVTNTKSSSSDENDGATKFVTYKLATVAETSQTSDDIYEILENAFGKNAKIWCVDTESPGNSNGTTIASINEITANQANNSALYSIEPVV